jgi:hypothetical protein
VSCLPVSSIYKYCWKTRSPSGSGAEEYLPGYPAPDYILSSSYFPTILEINIVFIKTKDKTELQAICKVYPKDTTVQRILNNLEEYKIYQITKKGTILFEEQVYIPKTIKNQVVQTRYSIIPYSYPGIGKTLELVSRIFYFPGIKKVVEKIINTCNICCRNKAARYILYSKLYLLNIPPGV